MKRIVGIALFAVIIILISLLNKSIGTTPPLGKFFSPSHGFWQNADPTKDPREKITIKGLSGKKVKIIYDEYRVPHIFAENENDLFYAQGYITARERLWQMEFQTHFAAGRLSEIVGDKALELDRYNRRIGLLKVAKETLDKFSGDLTSQMILDNYTAGVNAYINKLNSSDYPVEYKLLGYKPEKWTRLKCILLLKYMANTLTGGDTDLEYTNALRLFGRETFDKLYPDFPKDQDPIIPAGTKWSAPSTTSAGDSLLSSDLYFLPAKQLMEPVKGLGSNNWSVSGSKTASGKPILCNDPHLSLSFPSIWFQMQLHAPGYNAVGVTIPGAPGIIIGHNDNIAWGVTNGTADVRDWYSIQYKNGKQEQYLIGNTWHPVERRTELIRIKGQKDFTDTIKWTMIGPVVYDKTFGGKQEMHDICMRWQALQPSNELMAFYLLNKGENHQDYLRALDHYECPTQNFVYADAAGNIAIKEQGKLPIHRNEGGKFIAPLASVDLKTINNYVPFDQNPYVLNPERGFCSSANQHPTDQAYPYYYHGQYEYQRNRRINNVLRELDSTTVKDMQKLQNDNHSMLAAESLPLMLAVIRERGGLTTREKEYLMLLSKWNFAADEGETEATLFYQWWKELEAMAWDEFKRKDATLVMPESYILSRLLRDEPEFPLFDIKKTGKKETAADLITASFDSMSQHFGNKVPMVWREYKNTRISHLAKIDAFSMFNLPIGGYNNIVNAASELWGPSWRMIVDFAGGKPKGYGVYPGGQSGNTGSSFYNDYVMTWAAGKYNPVLFFKDEESARKYIK